MDWSDPRIWNEGADIVLHNLHIVAPSRVPLHLIRGSLRSKSGCKFGVEGILAHRKDHAPSSQCFIRLV